MTIPSWLEALLSVEAVALVALLALITPIMLVVVLRDVWRNRR